MMSSSGINLNSQVKSIQFSYEKLLFVAEAVSAVVLALDAGRTTIGAALLVCLSLFIARKPSAFIPLLFVSSWSSSIAVFSLSAFYYYLAIFCVSLAANPKGWSLIKGNNVTLILLVLFSVWLIISGKKGVTGDVYVPVKLALCVFFTAMACKIRLADFSFSNKSLFLLAIIFAVFFLVRSVFFPTEFVSDSRTELTLVPGMGTNCIAQVTVLLFLFLFCRFLSTGNWKGVAFSLLYFIPLFYLGSRTSLYTSVFLGAGLLLFGSKRSLKTKIILSVLVLVLFLAATLVGQNMFENFGRLGLSTVLENQGSGRFQNWLLYSVDIIPSYPLFGIGTGIDNYNTLGYQFDADNLYMDLLCETGFPGFLLFFGIVASVLSGLSRMRNVKQRKLVLVLILSLLMIGFGESVYDSPLTWFILGFGLFSINASRQDRPGLRLKRHKDEKVFCSAG